MAEDVWELRTKGSVDSGGEGGLELSGKRNVCKGNALRCKERTDNQVLFEENESGSQAVLKNGVDLEGG